MKRRVNISHIRVGGIARAVSARIEVTHSEPPLRYNEATLLDDMLNAHRYAQTEADAAVLQATNGIGTARTRSESIMDLIRNKSLVRDESSSGGPRPSLRLSAAGRALGAVLPAELKSVALTAKWEVLLRMIERGQLPADEFKRRNDIFVGLVVKEAKRQKELHKSATTPNDLAENQVTV